MLDPQLASSANRARISKLGQCVQTSLDGNAAETCCSVDFCDRRALDFRVENLKNCQAFGEREHEIRVALEAPEFQSCVFGVVDISV